MSDGGTTTTGETWYSTLEPEALGHLQTRGWDKLDPAAAALEAVKGHWSATKMLGIPQDQLLRVPADAADEAGWKTLWQRLGAPEKADDYDFSGVDLGDEGLTGKIRDAARAAAVELNLPKDRAERFAAALNKAFGEDKIAKTTETTAAAQAEQASLRQNWGNNFDANMFVADKAAERLGVTPEAFTKIKDGIGGAAAAELFRKIGEGLGEDRFIRDPSPGGRQVMTREQAVARKTELLGDMRQGSGDQGFIDRYMKGDAAARREVAALDQLIVGGA